MVPQEFLQRLEKIVPQEHLAAVLEGFARPDILSLRVNTLKATVAEARDTLSQEGLSFSPVAWSETVLIMEGVAKEKISAHPLVTEGKLYFQALSSLLPAIVLDPQPGERVLDFCAAPGSKTTQMSALMQNKGEIVAVDSVKPRFFKLRAVCKLLGADNVSFKLCDARRFRDNELFDRILVDAPCSSEGRFKTFDKKTVGYWSQRKIKEMAHKQKGLLLSASRLLKPGGRLVYSTCTFSPEENEGVVDWFLRKAEGFSVEPVRIPGVLTYPCLTEWEGRGFSPEVRKACRVLPSDNMNGFFIASFIKNKET
jgi:16S rRNA (cytosine1407-C5)-methyltransferase